MQRPRSLVRYDKAGRPFSLLCIVGPEVRTNTPSDQGFDTGLTRRNPDNAVYGLD